MRFLLNAMLVAIIVAAFGCASEEDSLRQRTGRWKSPVIVALDANRDDIIDAGEIAGSPTALKTLDKNRDGQLTPDEYTPLHFINSGSQRPQAMEKGETEFKPSPGFPQLPTLPTGAAPPP